MAEVISRQRWQWTLLACLVLAGVMGLVRIDSVPLDSHEIFVAGTTRAMSERQDWILPWFNGAPRLNKPPMSYWATGAVAAIAGDLPEVAPWHVRLVSVLAGLGIVLCTAALGCALFDERSALLGAALVASSAGLFTFMHDGRPDLLYAFFTSLMLLGLVRCFINPVPSLRWWALAWVACALAVLTKGPQLPVMLLLGMFPSAYRHCGTVAALRARLHPVFGLLLAAGLCAPWWVAISARLGETRIESSQLGGQLLAPSLTHLAELYYLYRPLQLALPWLVPFLLIGFVFVRRQATRENLGWLAGPLLAATLLLSLGQQYRYFYLLPLIAPLMLLAARLLMSIDGKALGLMSWSIQAVAVAACLVWVLLQAAQTRLGAGLALGAGIIVALWAIQIWRDDAFLARWLPLAFLMGATWAGAAATGAVWNSERYADHALAVRAAQMFPPELPVAALGVSPTLYAWTLQRDVRGIARVDDVATWMPNTATVGLIVSSSWQAPLAQRYRVEVLNASDPPPQPRLLLLHRKP